MRRKTTARSAGAAAAWGAWVILVISAAGLAAPPRRATEEERSWPLNKLPGCDDLAQRMAKYYKPLPVTFKLSVPAYKLPVDLSKR